MTAPASVRAADERPRGTCAGRAEDWDLTLIGRDKAKRYAALHECKQCPILESCKRDALDNPPYMMIQAAMVFDSNARPAEAPTECRNGHDITAPESVMQTKNGERRCRRCHRESVRRAWRKRRAAA